jgi:hypothetical protein
MFARVLQRRQSPRLPNFGGQMTVAIDKLKKFQQQHLESQVQCGEELKSVPKAGCIKEWALIEIALNLRALNEKFDQNDEAIGFRGHTYP